MAAFDDLVPQFRKARDRWPDAPLLTSHYAAVVESYDGSGHDIIGSIKSFIECVCKTILGECGKAETSSTPTTTQLLGETLKSLGLQNSKGASKLDDVLSAHNKMADALSFMRNNHDPGAHGKDGFLDTLSTNENRAYLITADSILALLLAAYDGTEPDLRYTREPYERFARFHNRVDNAVSIDAFVDDDGDADTLVVTLRTPSLPDGIELRLEPSKLLYAVDRTAYVELLASALSTSQPASQADSADEVIADQQSFEVVKQTPVLAQMVTAYDGPLSTLKPMLVAFLGSLGGLEGVAATSTSLPDSLLAAAGQGMGLDWIERESLQAALKVSMRRTLTKFGVESERAESTAERHVGWFRANASLAEASPAA